MRTLASGQAARLSIWGTRVRIPPSLPCVPLVQWITTRVYETRDSGSSPERDTKVRRAGCSGASSCAELVKRARLPAARMRHCLCLDGGSIPLAPAKGLITSTSGLSPLTLNQLIAGSNPAVIAKLMRGS
jgi:hypothetical protein